MSVNVSQRKDLLIELGTEELPPTALKGLSKAFAAAKNNDKRGRKGNQIDLAGRAMITDVEQIAGIVFGETRGRQAIQVTLADGTELPLLRVSDIDVLDPRGKVIGELYDLADDRVIKAGWNWNLVNNDSSRGIHNPSFSLQVLEVAMGALIDLAFE